MPTITELESEATELAFSSFSDKDAYALGTLMASRAWELGRPIAVDIRRAGFTLFYTSIGGATADNQDWIQRKAAVSLRFEASTALMAERLAQRGDVFANGWLHAPSHAIVGGSVPISVSGAGVVAVATVSGIGGPDDDHRFVADAIRDYLAGSRS